MNVRMLEDMSPARYSCERGDSEGHNAVFDEESAASFQYDSASSVMKDKKEENLPQGLQEDNIHHGVLHHGFYVNSAENDVSVDNDGDHIVSNSSSFWSLDSWLLPLQTKNWGMDRIIKDDEYWHAVKYLQEAVNSTPPLLAALLPLIQLLLIGCNGKDALNELEKFCSNSSTAFPFRLLANILEHVDPNNSLTLSTCYEDTLRRDPTCSHTLTKLLTLHRNGDYDPDRMLEMIALHLDAVFAESNTWREFALCLLKVSQHGEDRMSACLHGNDSGQEQRFSVSYNRIAKLFLHGESGRAWRLRCRWWLRRHFSISMLASDIATGDLELLTYKAACASHMYGKEFEYVVKACACLEKANDRDLFSFLKLHVQNSIGLNVRFSRRTG